MDLEFCELKGLWKRQCFYPEVIPNDRTEEKQSERLNTRDMKTEGRKGARGQRTGKGGSGRAADEGQDKTKCGDARPELITAMLIFKTNQVIF